MSAVRTRSHQALLLNRFRRNRAAVTGTVLLALLYGLACFAGFLAPYAGDDADTRTTLYGPMLLGGYHAELVGTHTFATGDGGTVELPEYIRVWRFFRGGVHFHDSDGRFRLRPHVHPLIERVSYDAYGERHRVVAVDPSRSLPLRFLVEDRRERELFSLCGLSPVRGRRHLVGLEPLPAGAGTARLYLLGSDALGRDLLSRILFGGQISLSVGLVGIAVSISIALLVGGVAGYFGGWVDWACMRLIELLMGIPGLYLLLTLRAVFPAELSSRETYLMIVAVLALAGWAATGRVIRGMVLALRQEDYVVAARALGASHARVILRHILPNTLSFVIVAATLLVPYYILGEVALSFLGLGITEPDSSWGLLLKDAHNTEVLTYNPWLVLPGLFIFVAVLAFNFVGDGLRDAADPRSATS